MSHDKIRQATFASENLVASGLRHVFDVMTSWDTYFLTRVMANHHARSLICILWWRKVGNLEKPVREGFPCRQATMRAAACLHQEFVALFLS